jgi:hypothetical protein
VLVANGYSVSLPAGPSKRTRVFDVRIRISRQEKGSLASSVTLYVRGAWYGSIGSDRGVLKVRLVENGGFGKWGKLLLGRTDGQLSISGGSSSMLDVNLAPLVVFDNRLYSVTATPAGDAVTIKPYGGPTGTLTASATNGYGKPVASYCLKLGYTDMVYYLSGTQTVRVPVGEWACAQVAFEFDYPSWTGFSMESAPFAVTRGKNTRLRLGGPIHYRMSAEKTLEGLWLLNCTPVMRYSQKLDDFPRRIGLKLVLKNTTGKVVFADEKSTNSGSDLNWFELPGSLAPGDYVALLTASFESYDKNRVFGARLQIR